MHTVKATTNEYEGGEEIQNEKIDKKKKKSKKYKGEPMDVINED